MKKPLTGKAPRRRGAGAVCLRDIADASGYSTATVSWALRGLARVPEATKKKVLEAAETLGYRPDPKLTELAAHLRHRRHRQTGSNLALITADPVDLRTTPWLVAKGIFARAEELGYGIEVFQTGKALGGYSPDELSRVLISRNIQGLILTCLSASPVLTGFGWSRFSAVTISNILQEPRLHRVCSHHFQSLLLACEKLHERGYRRIGLVLDAAMDARDKRERHAAFLFHGDTSGAAALPPLIKHPLTDELLEHYFRTHRPDCILYPNRAFLNRILHVWQRMGPPLPREPGHASLHLFPDDTDLAGIDQDAFNQGHALVDMVVGMILSNERGIPLHRKTILVDGIWRDGNPA